MTAIHLAAQLWQRCRSPLAAQIWQRCRLPLAGLFGLCALVLLWAGLGLSDLLPRPGVAVAESHAPGNHAAPRSLPKARAALLQSSVDSVALSLGSAFALSASPSLDEQKKRRLMASALDGLTFGLGGEVYFTAWQGTRMAHSPLSPDSADMDFADALDERGAAFVRSMESVASEGGGFIRVALPRQFADRLRTARTDRPRNPDDAEIVRALERLAEEAGTVAGARVSGPVVLGEPIRAEAELPDLTDLPNLAGQTELFADGPGYCSLGDGQACGQPLPCPESVLAAHPVQAVRTAEPVEQVVYVRAIPQSRWHIAAFMPVHSAPGAAPEGFSAVWTPDGLEEAAALERLFRKGLCLSGFSLAGLAGLMLMPGLRRPPGTPEPEQRA